MADGLTGLLKGLAASLPDALKETGAFVAGGQNALERRMLLDQQMRDRARRQQEVQKFAELMGMVQPGTKIPEGLPLNWMAPEFLQSGTNIIGVNPLTGKRIENLEFPGPAPKPTVPKYTDTTEVAKSMAYKQLGHWPATEEEWGPFMGAAATMLAQAKRAPQRPERPIPIPPGATAMMGPGGEVIPIPEQFRTERAPAKPFAGEGGKLYKFDAAGNAVPVTTPSGEPVKGGKEAGAGKMLATSKFAWFDPDRKIPVTEDATGTPQDEQWAMQTHKIPLDKKADLPDFNLLNQNVDRISEALTLLPQVQQAYQMKKGTFIGAKTTGARLYMASVTDPVVKRYNELLNDIQITEMKKILGKTGRLPVYDQQWLRGKTIALSDDLDVQNQQLKILNYVNGRMARHMLHPDEEVPNMNRLSTASQREVLDAPDGDTFTIQGKNWIKQDGTLVPAQ